MSVSIKDIKNRQEFIVSVILLVVMCTILAAVLIKQAYYDTASFGMAAVKTDDNSHDQVKSKPDLLSPAGFRPLLQAEKYNRDNLYEKIDGKATLYLESGFRGMTTRRYVSVNDGSIWLELFIYDMGDAKNAYSVYGQQRREDARGIPGMATAYRTSNAAFMVLGNYYIEILGASGSQAIIKAILDMCARLKANLKPSGTQSVSRVSLIDERYLVAGTDKLNLKSAFGYSSFRNVYTAKYRYKGRTVTVFLSEMKTADEAASMADGYYGFLTENGGEQKKGDAAGAKFVSLYGSFEAVFHCGKFVAGVHEADTMETAEIISQLLSDKICGVK